MYRLCLTAVLLASPALAQKPPPLKWGMDATGGAPYVYDNNTKGFEVELAAYLAEKLGRVSEPVNGEWNKLPELLQRGDLDIVLNGYEFSDQFKEQASVPYYLYRFTATVRADGGPRTWNDLKAKPGEGKKKVGVLTGSAAMRYLQKEFGDSIQLEIHDDVANTFKLVADGGLDATVQDNPASTFYVGEDAKKDKKLHTLGESRGQGFYVILTRKDAAPFRERVNAALRAGIDDGALEAILKKYGLWNEDQERLSYWSKKKLGTAKN